MTHIRERVDTSSGTWPSILFVLFSLFFFFLTQRDDDDQTATTFLAYPHRSYVLYMNNHFVVNKLQRRAAPTVYNFLAALLGTSLGGRGGGGSLFLFTVRRLPEEVVVKVAD